MTLIIRCETCSLDYDETAYRHHLGNPCEHGIYPMLACDQHGIDCEYNNPVWRYESRDLHEPLPKARTKLWKSRKCKPIYTVYAGRIHYRSDQEMWSGTYLALTEPDKQPPRQAPRLPKEAT